MENIEDEDQKKEFESTVTEFASDLSTASDTCSAGKIGQKYGYSAKEKIQE